MEFLDFLSRLFSATLAGMIIGFERQWRLKSAGMRTNALVSTGAAIYVLLSFKITGSVGGDITRIIGQVVTGIGFLGAGLIFKEGFTIRGLSTAATVWCSAAVGCICASGFYLEGLTCTGIILFINVILMPITKYLKNRKG